MIIYLKKTKNKKTDKVVEYVLPNLSRISEWEFCNTLSEYVKHAHEQMGIRKESGGTYRGTQV